VVDAANSARLAEAKEALHVACRDMHLKDAFVCVVVNKSDLGEKAQPDDEVSKLLELSKLPGSKTRAMKLVRTSAAKGEGIGDLKDFLAIQVKK